MIVKNHPFWSKIPHDSKIDVLNDPNHLHIVHEALRDKETDIEIHPDGTFTLYGRQEALLVIPRLMSTNFLLLFYGLIKRSG